MEENRPAIRRYDRLYVRLPVSLLSISPSGPVEQIGSVMDLSKGGLRIQTSCVLPQGQYLEVSLRGADKPYATCRVVWSHTRGSALPSEAGLEIFPAPLSMDEEDERFLAELREVYHNPAAAR